MFALPVSMRLLLYVAEKIRHELIPLVISRALPTVLRRAPFASHNNLLGALPLAAVTVPFKSQLVPRRRPGRPPSQA